MDAVVSHPNGIIRLKELDVCNDEPVERAIREVIAEAGKIDIVVSNAGFLEIGPILDVPIDRVQRVFDTNLYGTLRLARSSIPHMATRHSGLFVLVGSVGGIIPTPWTGIYAATKAAVHSVAANLQMECTPLGVNVMLLAPGGVTSGLSKKTQEDYEMPESSLYKSYSNAIIERMWSSQTKYATPSAEFARTTVNQILKPSPPTFRSNGGGSFIYYILSWLPRWLALAFLWRQFGKKNKTTALYDTPKGRMVEKVSQ
ncbi:hypothetical protein FRB94_008394 [Tulasnella sp. JGI-2019a]|nr:hypothetical protein FRB94_008394 [Tulasnella sp. JGI-2019a]